MNGLRSISLRTRLLLSFTTLLVVLASGTGFIAVKQIRRALDIEFVANLQSTARNFARINHDNIITYNYAELDRDLRLTRQQMGLEFIVLRYALNREVHHSDSYGDPGTLPKADINTLFEGSGYQVFETNMQPVATYQYDIEISGRRWAMLVVGRSMHAHLETVREVQSWFALIGLGVVGVGAVLSWFLSLSLTQPLKQLMVAIEGIGQSAKPVAVPSHGNDEIGKLARVFSVMQQRIQAQLQRLKLTNQRLEQAQEVAQLGMWELSSDQQRIHTSVIADKILRLPPGQTNGFSAKELVQHFVTTDQQQFLSHLDGAKSYSGYEAEFVCQLQAMPLLGERHISFRISCAKTSSADETLRITGTVHDVSKEFEARKQISELAYLDAVTQLPNRRRFLELLDQLLDIEYFHRLHVAVVFMDADKFKFINDTYGHSAGDRVLAQIACSMGNALRTDQYEPLYAPSINSHLPLNADSIRNGLSIFSRFGGDEFVALIAMPSAAHLQASLNEVGVLIAGIRVTLAGSHESLVTLSAGCTLASPDTPKNRHLLDEASYALHFSKLRYASQLIHFDTRMKSEMEARTHIEYHLRDAVKNWHFKMTYQPIMKLKNNRILCFEALLRWPDNPSSVKEIQTVVSMIEEIGLAGEFTRRVIEQVASDMQHWKTQSGEEIAVSINLSPKFLRNPDIISYFEATLSEYALFPGNWFIEITESEPLKNNTQVSAQLNRLSKMGVQVWVDDFGTGYSSLAYLSQFHFDAIKVDKTLIQAISRENSDRSDRVVAEVAVNMGKKLGLTVIAEGVETPAQLHALKALKCDAWQGYLLAKPMPADAVLQWQKEQTGNTSRVIPFRT